MPPLSDLTQAQAVALGDALAGTALGERLAGPAQDGVRRSA